MATESRLCHGRSHCPRRFFLRLGLRLQAFSVASNFTSFTPSMSNNSTCYNWGGAVSTDVYCGLPSLSTCCGRGWDCLSNGLCRQHGTTAYSQGTCTDSNFQNCLSICNQGQFNGFTEVSRCESNDNSWCCAGAAGQGLGDVNCCDTTLTTSLEPYPFSTIDSSEQSAAASTSVSSTATFTTSALSSSLTTTAAPTARSATVVTPETSFIGLTGSLASTTLQTSTTVLTSSAQPPPARHNNDTTIRIEVGVLVTLIVVFLAVVALFMYQRTRKHKLGLVHLRPEMMGDPLPCRPEMDGGGAQLAAELDITHYELTQPDAPRHELW